MRDRGSMLVLTVMVGVAITAATLVATDPLFDALQQRQRARSAADAAALAGATGGREAAAELAAANDGVLVGWVDDGSSVTVTVRVGGRIARARATDRP